MKKSLFTLLFLVISLSTFAQTDSSHYNPNITRKLYALKSLNKINGSYYYGERKLTGFYALEVPFFELNDAEVNRHYKQFKTFTNVGRAISIVPTIFLLANLSNNKLRQSGFFTQTYFTIVFASIGGNIVCDLVAKSHIKKAAIRYNKAIGKDNLGYWQFKNDDNSLGMSLKYNF